MTLRLVIMGVSGCGKSTVGMALAHRLGLQMLDGDDLHAPESVARMKAGQALSDADRWPWLERIGQRLAAQTEGAGLVVACSALRRSYRDRIREHAHGVRFVFLDGSFDLIAERVGQRVGHYMPASLLQSQFDTLERPDPQEADVLRLDIDGPVDALVNAAATALNAAAMPPCDLGLVGLGVMGENLALNFERNGFAVCGFDSDPARRQRFGYRTRGRRAHTAQDMQQLVATLRRPRRVLVMVPAGAAVDAVIDVISPLLEPGDILLDGGNTHPADTQRRLQALGARGLLYVGLGVSGGEQGALYGPALMPGGDANAWPLLRPMLQAIAARAGDGLPCCQWVGPGGSGHFVKMVHNGIEYADMQILCEAYALMRDLLQMPAREIALAFRQWNRGPLESYLVQITADILEREDPESGQMLVDCILDTAEQKGTGKWTSQVALDLGTPAPTIAQAVFARSLSAMKDQRVRAAPLLAGAHGVPQADRTDLLRALEGALLAAKVCAYAQGLALLRAADSEYRWGLSLSGIASLWRAGCIIRASLLEDIRAAYDRNASLDHLLLDPPLAERMSQVQQDLREVVSLGARGGVALPALMSALAYYDALRSPRLPANLLQAQRDFFGAHGYQRHDRPGQFHTDWQRG